MKVIAFFLTYLVAASCDSLGSTTEEATTTERSTEGSLRGGSWWASIWSGTNEYNMIAEEEALQSDESLKNWHGVDPNQGHQVYQWQDQEQNEGMSSTESEDMLSCPMHLIWKLVDNRHLIHRTVVPLADGRTFHTKTISEDSQVAEWIQLHVSQMMSLVQERRGRIRQWDPLFREIFDRAQDIHTQWKNIANGVSVRMTGLTDCGIALADAHTKVVSLFIRNGAEEVHNKHPAPEICASA